ncbi:MAG: L-threonylcarbamoyladenylate synthase [Sediminibacterium sp.]
MEEDIAFAVEALKKGDIILYPTDTVWGIGCDATNASAVSKVYALKQRADSKAMIVLVPEEQWILNYVAESEPKVADYIKGITKPTTVIYEHAKNLAQNLIAADGTIAIRICKANFAQQLMKAVGKPIVSTSANISGLPTPMCFKDISLDIIDGVDYVVRSEQEDTLLKQPSAIVKWEKGQLIVIRP